MQQRQHGHAHHNPDRLDHNDPARSEHHFIRHHDNLVDHRHDCANDINHHPRRRQTTSHRRVRRRREGHLGALADPPNFNADTIRATYASGEAQANVISALTDLQRQGFRYRPGPLGLDYYVVEDLKLLDGPPVTKAELFTCQVSDGVVYDPRDPNNPDDDAIVNAELGSHRYKWTMVVEDGTWKRLSSEELEHKTGVNVCPPKPGS
jgi:hypothetical protein